MAKKKKPAANPARGFATTSVASKPKANKDVDIASASSTSMVEPAGGAEVISVPPKDLQITELRLDEPSAKTHELSPEDLEEQLERNELQLMIEKHGPKVVKESSRQISKVQTDRRVLRGQAQDLHTREWLPEELMLQILDLTKDDVSRGNYSREQNGKSKSISEEDSVVKFWALYRTLSEFGVSPEHIQKVIRQLVVNPPSNDSSGQLWGFSEALDLIALECEEHELPSFNRRLQSTAERSAASSTPGKFYFVLWLSQFLYESPCFYSSLAGFPCTDCRRVLLHVKARCGTCCTLQSFVIGTTITPIFCNCLEGPVRHCMALLHVSMPCSHEAEPMVIGDACFEGKETYMWATHAATNPVRDLLSASLIVLRY